MGRKPKKRNPPRLTANKKTHSRIAALKGTGVGQGDLSLATLFEVAEVLSGLKGPGSDALINRKITQGEKANREAARKRWRRRKARETKEKVREKARERRKKESGYGWWSDAPYGLLPKRIEGMLSWKRGEWQTIPDGVGLSRIADWVAHGWLEAGDRITGGFVRVRQVYRLTPLGEIVQDWTWHLAAHHALDLLRPAIGPRLEHVNKWIRGEVVDLGPKYNRKMAYQTGDAEEVPWSSSDGRLWAVEDVSGG